MARTLSKGEKPLDWVGSSKRDFLGFPEPVKDEMGNALGVAIYRKTGDVGYRRITFAALGLSGCGLVFKIILT